MTEDAIKVVIFMALLVGRLIREAIAGNEEALTVLAELPWTLDLIKRVSTSVAARFHEDRDEIASELWLILRTKISSLEQPQRLGSWLYVSAKNQCSNRKRHLRVERVHCGAIVLFNSQEDDSALDGTDAPTDSGVVEETEGRPLVIFAQEVLRSNTSQSPEDESLEKEQETVEDELLREHLKRLRAVTSAFPSKIVSRWAIGMRAKQIHDETGIALSTVYRTLKKMELAIYAEFAVALESK